MTEYIDSCEECGYMYDFKANPECPHCGVDTPIIFNSCEEDIDSEIYESEMHEPCDKTFDEMMDEFNDYSSD